MVERSTYSRLFSGSASMPSKPSSEATVEPIMSARVSVSASTSAGGASRLAKMDTGRTAALPGVYTANSALARIRRMRSPSWSQSASP